MVNQSADASALTVDDLTNLPILPIGNEGEVPHQPAIFFTLTTTGRILKIGSSPDLGEDWRTQLRAIVHCDLPEVKSVWLAVSDPALLPKLEQLFIDQFKPVLNRWDSKLSRIADLTIDGWYDFQKVDGKIWGFYGNGMMPLPVPSAIAWEYQNAIREQASAITRLNQALGIESNSLRFRLATSTIEQLEARIQTIQNEQFVCPPRCWVSHYNVKRPWGIYYYFKLMSEDAIFPARSKKNASKMVKTLHLGRFYSLAEAKAFVGWDARKEIERLQRRIEVLREFQNLMG